MGNEIIQAKGRILGLTLSTKENLGRISKQKSSMKFSKNYYGHSVRNGLQEQEEMGPVKKS